VVVVGAGLQGAACCTHIGWLPAWDLPSPAQVPAIHLAIDPSNAGVCVLLWDS
jgi:hypothetical protein